MGVNSRVSDPRVRWKPLLRWMNKGMEFSRNRCTDSSTIDGTFRSSADVAQTADLGNNGEGKLAFEGWSQGGDDVGGGGGDDSTAEEVEELFPKGDRGLPCNPNRRAFEPKPKSFSGAFPSQQFDFCANK